LYGFCRASSICKLHLRSSPLTAGLRLNIANIMAQAAGSPDTPTRSLPSWVAAEQSETFDEAIKALETYKKRDPSKGMSFLEETEENSHPFYMIVIVRFKAVGNAPIMKQNFYKITSSNRFQAVIQFLRKELGWQAGEPLVSRYSTHVSRFCNSCCLLQSSPTSTSRSPLPRTTLYPTCLRYDISHIDHRFIDLPAVQSFSTDGHLIVNYRYASYPCDLPTCLMSSE
jgi:hypothetical protein